MNNHFKISFIIAICFLCGISSYSQANLEIIQIDNYCDSLDKIKDIQFTSKSGGGVALDYITSEGKLIKIIEHPAGYKFISASETYYLKNLKPVYIYADIEISNDDGSMVTLELHKIYLENTQILKYSKSEQKFNPDSLYNNNSDPVNTIVNLKKNARFKPGAIDKIFEKTLLQAIDNYIKARNKKDGDPFIEELSSPFI
jgi:hypothetical protein